MSVSKVIPLAYSPTAIRAALIQFKGAEKGPATFEAVAPVFSAMLASGGSKAELSSTTATAQVFKELHAETLKTPTAKAFRQCCVNALTMFKATGRAKDQAAHDGALLELSAVWCTFFRDAVKTVSEKEKPSATIARLTAELAAMRVERDAIASALTQSTAELAAMRDALTAEPAISK